MLRLPPHSLEAEQSVLGAVLLDNSAIDRVADVLGVDDFYRDDHRRIWRHILRLVEASQPADLVTVSEALEAGDDKGRTGGAPYLASLVQNTPSAVNVRRYAELVRERSIQRRLAQIATEIAEDALSGGSDLSRMLDQAESRILQVSETGARRGVGLQPISDVLAKVFERIDHLHSQDNPSDITGVPTGFVDLDSRTAGLQPGDLIIIAGRPSMGKTALALNIAEHVALQKDERLPVAIFSMEMTGSQLGQRMLASRARADAHRLRTGRLNDDEWGRVCDAIAEINEGHIHIDDSGALNALEVRARARRLRRQYGRLGLVVVDYLQLMTTSGAREENRATEISEISRGLKAMAKELDCPVIALSQLNRKVDERPDRRPVMSDLRESGAIEQDADVILFLYREVVYKPNLPEDQRALAEVIIGKQRSGPIGTVNLMFFGQHTRFVNYAGGGMDFAPGR